jgi:hypothetical protein
MKLATSVSTTSLDVVLGGDVDVALLIDPPYERFCLLSRARVDVAQQPIQREWTDSYESCGLLHEGYVIHLDLF